MKPLLSLSLIARLPVAMLSIGLLLHTALATGVPLGARVGLAIVAGATLPPVGACLRALLPTIVVDREALHRAYATDAAAVELTWVAGPPIVLAVGVAVSTGAALAAAGALLACSTLAFAASPASRAWRPEVVERRHGALRAPGLQTLAAVLLATRLVFGGVEVAV